MPKTGLIIYIGLMSFISNIATGQFIDNYGLRAGVGLSNQHWDYKNSSLSYNSAWKDDKPGLAIYLNAEKELGKFISIRPELGYIQKGFKEEISIKSADNTEVKSINGSVVLHDLSLNIGVKVKPFSTKLQPYLILGLRGDYLLGYQDLKFQFEGQSFGLHKSVLDDYEKFVLSGLIGIGFSYDNLVYLDFEFNPAITNNLKRSGFSIRDRFFGVSLGLNINELIEH